jgi:hypothetical protein
MYDEVFPQLDMLVSQLYRALRVQNIDSIVPAVQALIAHGQLQLGGAAAMSTSSGPLSTGSAQMSIHQGQHQHQHQHQHQPDSQSEPAPVPASTAAANSASIALSSSTSHFEVSSFARAVDADEAQTLRALTQPSHQQ